MSGPSRAKGEPMAAILLARGTPRPQVARTAGVSAKTLERRLADPAYRAEIQRYRDEMVDRTIGKLTDLGVVAVDVLARLLESKAEYIQLGAVREVFANLPIRATKPDETAGQEAERGALLDFMERAKRQAG